MPQTGDPRPAPTALVSALFVVLFAVILVGLQAYYAKAEREEFDRKVLLQSFEERDRTRAEQLQRIQEYRWLDQDSGILAIPIERAMELVVHEFSGSPRPQAAEQEGGN